MFTPSVVIVLRAVHVVAGVLWVGAAFVLAAYLIPSVRSAGPSGGAVMRQVVEVRKLPALMQWVTWLTLLSGVALYWRLSGGFSTSWWSTSPGLAFGAGGLLAIVAAGYGVLVSSPTARRMGELGHEISGSKGPPTPEQGAEMARLQDRLLHAGRIGAVLLLASTVLMAVARYL